jgi:hypothetical protein
MSNVGLSIEKAKAGALEHRMNEEATRPECACGLPAKWARSAHFPVTLDDETGEYQMIHGPPEHRAVFIMRFCFWCGGRLPSRRASLFMEPDEQELESLRVLLRDARSIADVLQRLGPPDIVHEWADDPSGLFPPTEVRRWKRSLQYSKCWKTLDLQVFEMPDGSVNYATSGKHISPDDRP